MHFPDKILQTETHF